MNPWVWRPRLIGYELFSTYHPLGTGTAVRLGGRPFSPNTLYAETTILDKSESKGKPDRGIVYVETRAINQRNEIILTLRRKILLYKRGFGPSTP